MGDEASRASTISHDLTALALRQHGNVTRQQLLALGFTRAAIAHRLAHGFLHRIHPGVYAVGRPPGTPLERAAAAVLACGPTAVLSHASALVLWGIWRRWETPFQVTITRGDRRPSGIATHRSPLHPADIRTHWGLRVTSPARAILDCAPAMTARTLTRAVNDARHAHILTLDQLAQTAARATLHPGAKLLRSFVETPKGPTRSEFEDRFVAFCARHGLPAPTLNTHVCGHEVDALFEAEKVIVELDGWEFHRDRSAFEADRERDGATAEAGYITRRLTWERLTTAEGAEAARLRRILSARRAPRATRAAPAPARRAPRRRARRRSTDGP